MYQIRLTNRSTGNSYYFRNFRIDGSACSVMHHRRKLAMYFPSIFAAACVVPNIDSSKWRAVIVRHDSYKLHYRLVD